MKLKFSFLLLFIIILTPLALSVPPVFQLSNTAQGYVIEIPKFLRIQENNTFTLHTHVFNATTGHVVPVSDYSCTVHLYNNTGNHLMEIDMVDDGSGLEKSLNIGAGNFSVPGLNSYTIQCNNSNSGGFISGSYEVTPSGYEIDSNSRANLIIAFILLIAFIGLLFFYATFFSNSSLPLKFTLLIVGITFLLISIDIIGIAIKDETTNPKITNFLDVLITISFVFYWAAMGLLIIIWAFTFLNTWLYKKNMESFTKFGGNKYG